MTYLGYFTPSFGWNEYDNVSLFSKYSINVHAVKSRYLVFIRSNRLYFHKQPRAKIHSLLEFV